MIFVKWFFFSIFAMNSISILRNLISKIITSKILDWFSLSRSNSNHLSVSRIFQNSYQIFSELIVFFYSLDQLNISSKNFRIFSQYFFKQSALKSFFYSKIDHITYLLIIANRHFFFVTKIVSIIESENQSIFRQNFQYWQSHISIWIIFDSWKFSKITFVCFANQFRLFNIDDEIDNISNSNFKFVFQNFVERVSTRIIFFLRNNCKITFNYLVNQR